MRVILYPRVSDRKQLDGHSLDSQEEDMRGYAKEQGWDVVGVEREVWSAHDSLYDRPRLNAALERIRKGEADILLTWKQDRASRDINETVLLSSLVRGAGGKLAFVHDGGLQGDTDEDDLIMVIRAYKASKERKDMAFRVQRNTEQRVKEGKLLAGPVAKFGYHYWGSKKDTYIIDEEAAEVVRNIFRMRDEGKSYRDIAARLCEAGHPTPSLLLEQRGQRPEGMKLVPQWSHSMVKQVLKDPSYCGRHQVFRHYTHKLRGSTATGRPRKEMLLRGEDDTKVVEHPIPAIVDPALWDRVQTIPGTMTETSGRWQNGDEESTLLRGGFVVCGHCGGRMGTSTHKDGYRLYRCQHGGQMATSPDKACPGGSYALRASTVDEDTWEKVKNIAEHDERFNVLIERRLAKMSDRFQTMRQRVRDVKEHREKALQRQKRLQARLGEEADPVLYTALREQYLVAAEELKGYEDKKADIDKAERVLASMEGAFAVARKLLAKERGRLDDLTREEKRYILRTLGVRVLCFSRKYAKEQGITPNRWLFTFQDENSDLGLIGDRMDTKPLFLVTWAEWQAA